MFGWVENGWVDPGKAAGNNNGAAATTGNWAEASDRAVPI